MVTFTYTIQGAQGLHARPVACIARAARDWESSITITCGTSSTQADDLMGLMALGGRRGDELEVRVEGADEQEAADALRLVFTF